MSMKNDFRDYICHSAEEELCHFGILGMKWGVRRYQNSDGTLTEAGKKRYLKPGSDHALSEKGAKKYYKDIEVIKKSNAKDIYKSISKKNFIDPNTQNGKKKYWDNINNTSKKITNAVKATSNPEEIKDAADWYDKFNKQDIWGKFFKSEERKHCRDVAYKNTFDTFKEREPEYLNAIIKANNGSTKGLEAFHDFRKVFEGTDDYFLDDAVKEFSKNHKKDVDTYKNAFDMYAMKRDDLLNRALGYDHTKHDFSGYFITLDDGRVIPLGIDDDFKV